MDCARIEKNLSKTIHGEKLIKRTSSIDDQMSIYNSVIKCWNKRVNNTGDLEKNQRAIVFVFKIYINSEKESFFFFSFFPPSLSLCDISYLWQ